MENKTNNLFQLAQHNRPIKCLVPAIVGSIIFFICANCIELFWLWKIVFLVLLAIALFSIIKYCFQKIEDPYFDHINRYTNSSNLFVACKLEEVYKISRSSSNFKIMGYNIPYYEVFGSNFYMSFYITDMERFQIFIDKVKLKNPKVRFY